LTDDNMILAINAPQPAVQFPSHVFLSFPSLMDAVDVFLTMIRHKLRSLNDSMRSDIMLNIHMYMLNIHMYYKEKKKHTI